MHHPGCICGEAGKEQVRISDVTGNNHVFWLRVRLLVEVEFIVFSLSLELMFMNNNI
jgi:hypothetical protein